MLVTYKVIKLQYLESRFFPVLTKFLTHISPPLLTSCSKIQILKIQEGSWLSFWTPLNAITLQPFDRFWWNLVCWCALAFPTRRVCASRKYLLHTLSRCYRASAHSFLQSQTAAHWLPAIANSKPGARRIYSGANVEYALIKVRLQVRPPIGDDLTCLNTFWRSECGSYLRLNSLWMDIGRITL